MPKTRDGKLLSLANLPAGSELKWEVYVSDTNGAPSNDGSSPPTNVYQTRDTSIQIRDAKIGSSKQVYAWISNQIHGQDRQLRIGSMDLGEGAGERPSIAAAAAAADCARPGLPDLQRRGTQGRGRFLHRVAQPHRRGKDGVVLPGS